MRQIGSNVIYLWKHLSSGLRVFIVASFSLVFILCAVGGGLLFAIAAVGGVTGMMVGIFAIGFFGADIISALLFLAAIFVIASGLRACGASDEIAGLAAACIMGWAVVLYSLSTYRPPT
jgi:hypothetical protein